MLERVPGWTNALHDFMTERRGRPFAYGLNDCATFAFDAVLAITGTDVGEPFRGRYKTAAGASKVLRSFAGSDLQQALEQVALTHGMRPLWPTVAQRGDVGLGVMAHGPTVLVRWDAWFGPGLQGAERFTGTVSRAWAVGRTV